MAKPPKKLTFFETITAAVSDIVSHGYDSAERLAKWVFAIKLAAQAEMLSTPKLAVELSKFLRSIYSKQIDKAHILQRHPTVPRFTLQMVKPKLHAELERRIISNASLITLNREKAINDTMRRFEGWCSSVPAGGSKVVDKNEVKQDIAKSIKQLPFEERRVIIDQGHKFVSSLNEILASDGNAIAAVWHSQWRQRNYDYRKDHKERDLKVYAIRGNWAIEKGLMNKGAGYTDEITKPAEEPFCQCFYRYIYNITDLPPEMLTQKGKAAI